MVSNFPELMTKSYYKRVPSFVFRSSEESKKNFLFSAFQGDGSVETETASYNTSSKGLASDYQDLLLSLGISTRISSYLYEFGDNETRLRYKIYVRGESLEKFSYLFGNPVKNQKKLDLLSHRSSSSNYKKGTVPPQIADLIIRIMKTLKIPYDGHLWIYQKEKLAISNIVVKRYLNTIKNFVV